MPLACMTLAALSCSGGDELSGRREESVTTLGDADELLFVDTIGSLTETTSSTGVLRGSFAAYPYGVKRYDTSGETRKYAGTPRDEGVGLDAMGARSYAPDLGVWTSPDPVGLADAERRVEGRFSANNPYGYGSSSPVTYTDWDGEWGCWQLLKRWL